MKPFRTDHGLAWVLALLVWLPLIGGAALWLLVGSVAYWVKHAWLPANTEGWVQAIGSLLALVVAIGIPLTLKLQERATEREAKKQLQRAAYFQLGKLVEQIQYLLMPKDAVLLKDFYGDGCHAAYLYLLNIAKRLDELETASADQQLMTYTHKVRVEVFSFVQHLEPRDKCGEFQRSRLKGRVDELAREIQTVINAASPPPSTSGTTPMPVAEAPKPLFDGVGQRICDDFWCGLFFLIFSVMLCVGIERSQQNNNLNCFLNSVLSESLALKTFILLLILQLLFVGFILEFKIDPEKRVAKILMSPARIGRPICVSSGAIVFGLVLAGWWFNYRELSLSLLSVAGALFSGAWISFLLLQWFMETNDLHKDQGTAPKLLGKGLVLGALAIFIFVYVLIQRGHFLDSPGAPTCQASAVVEPASLPAAAK